jgi:flagellar biosynthesis/type III secretory pathway chaperone
MIDELIDTVRSLSALMREETEILSRAGPRRDVEELAAAKLRLTASLETQMVALEGETSWRASLGDEPRAALADAFEEMRAASGENAAVLLRQIELSRDMMDAVAAEAKRLSGSRAQLYGASGGLFQVDQSTPISVNTSL